MEMPPRDALVPLLKLAGTAVVAAAAYRYGSKHVVAAAHRQHRSRFTVERRRDGADGAKHKQPMSDAQDAAVATAASSVASAAEHTAPEIPRSSLIVAMLLQDGYLVR